MKDFNSIIILALVVVFFNSCQNDKKVERDDSAIRYRYYALEKMGWKSKKNSQKIDHINYTATEVPILYYLLKDNENKGQDLISVDSLYELNKRDRIVEFEFEDEKERDLLKEDFTGLDYQKSVSYMSFNIQQDFMVVTSSHDTIPCSGVLFERTFENPPTNKLLLFFTGIQPEQKIQLIYYDKLFKKGTLKFRFQEPILNL